MLQDASHGLRQISKTKQDLKKKKKQNKINAEQDLKRKKKKQDKINKAKICPYCLGALDLDNYSRDHLIPKFRGGKYVAHNTIICCKKCNFSKSCLMPLEFLFGCTVDHYYDKINNKNAYTILPFKLTR